MTKRKNAESEYFFPVTNLVDPDVAAVILRGRRRVRIEAAGAKHVEYNKTQARKLRDWLIKAIPLEGVTAKAGVGNADR